MTPRSIGAVSTVFSVARGVLLTPLPYDEPGEVVTGWGRWSGFPKTWVSEAEGSFTFQGQTVYCGPAGGDCTRYRPADVIHGVVATQDISATAWGFGLQGLSATFLVRGRGNLADDLTWPGSDDAFDAILAYAQYQRSIFRLRAGRQQTLSGLGFAGYDGVDLLVTPFRWLRRGTAVGAWPGASTSRGTTRSGPSSPSSWTRTRSSSAGSCSSTPSRGRRSRRATSARSGPTTWDSSPSARRWTSGPRSRPRSTWTGPWTTTWPSAASGKPT